MDTANHINLRNCPEITSIILLCDKIMTIKLSDIVNPKYTHLKVDFPPFIAHYCRARGKVLQCGFTWLVAQYLWVPTGDDIGQIIVRD